ncbi:MAG: cob(I)yrinic acid a,c-diamide adenosyltransferase [Melioribacteraceae bacterium]
MKNLAKGYIQIYTGDGKGKSTAAIGQAVRAAGAGLKSYIIQFMKDYPYSESDSLKLLSRWITVEKVGSDDYVFRKGAPPESEIEKAINALKSAELKMLGGEYDLIILDEVCVAIYFGLFKVEDVIPLLDLKPANVELILTGRYCPEILIEKADLVTEMKEVKHYYQNGILSRKGIDS